MKQFKVGDTVRLKKNLKVGNNYGGLDFLPGMLFDGSAVIEQVTSTEVSVSLKGNPYYYHFDMLIKVKPED